MPDICSSIAKAIPGADRRFARVGSFSYGAYGNESCMMVVDLDRRGYHRAPRTAWTPGCTTRARPGCRVISIHEGRPLRRGRL